jgi:hypothetical protein
MKCFHINDPDYYILTKCGNIHDSRTEKFWGHILTNKAKRTHEKYAWMFDPKGIRANPISYDMFKILNTSELEHVYIEIVSGEQFDVFISEIEYLSRF